ncbi:BTB/POZ and MATH domain-containing protein 1 [Rhynchospora pubera]|uniref:BTB/POZ and MATH domain-containing protein 1 n=1 Tax=Rhynchospora pubera TaxID=906938 RepID=A0AAV8CAV4_9POAL|nr:BTB/POZ and MATH domain-containing protein 1 [Rhynchospora pubera]
MIYKSKLNTFKSTSENSYAAWGCVAFKKRSEFEASKHLKDDAFTIQCTVTVLKGTNILQATTPYGVTVIPSNLNQYLVRLLESGQESDVTLVVKGERFKAHRLVLAARSPVFIPSNLNQYLVRLLESGQESDVTLVVKGERFKAHRLVLAARSPVFNAELFGCMSEKWTDTITVDDIEPLAFKSMLCFIYSDSFA